MESNSIITSLDSNKCNQNFKENEDQSDSKEHQAVIPNSLLPKNLESSFFNSKQKIPYHQLASYSAHLKKSKIAPRSSLQFKLGPPYGQQTQHTQVYALCSQKLVYPVIIARIDRGFDNIKDSWIGYKRNYFTSVASFQIVSEHTMPLNNFIKERFFINVNSKKQEVQYFATRLFASCCEDMREMELVQHTAKRDKGPQIKPPIHPIVPGELPTHEIIRDASNIKNDSKKKKYDADFFLHKDKIDYSYFDPNSILFKYPLNDIIKVARYERVQFSSSINQKRPLNSVKHFKLTTVLGAVVNGNMLGHVGENHIKGTTVLLGKDQTFIPLVSKSTPSLIIRGRSPSNYPSNNVGETSPKPPQSLASKNVTINEQPTKKKHPKITENNIIMEKNYVNFPHLIKNTNKNIDPDFKMNNFELSPTNNAVLKMGRSRKNKHSSIKLGKKIKNPPVLVSSRPNTSNGKPNNNNNNINTKKKSNNNNNVKKDSNQKKEAKLDDEGVVENELQYFLDNCDDTADIENLLMEQIMKNEMMKETKETKVLQNNHDNKNRNQSCLDFSLNLDDKNNSCSNFLSKEKDIHNSGFFSQLEESRIDQSFSVNPNKGNKRSLSESIIIPHIDLENQSPKKKQRSFSCSLESPGKVTVNEEIIRLNPHSEFEEFFISEKEKKKYEEKQTNFGRKKEKENLYALEQEPIYELLHFSSDNEEGLDEQEKIVLEELKNSKVYTNEEVKCVETCKIEKNNTTNNNYELVCEKGVMNDISVDSGIEQNMLMMIPRSLMSRDEMNYLKGNDSNIINSNMFLDEEFYVEDPLKNRNQEKDTSYDSFLLV
ncbi:p53-like transcription factor [Hanseniaspora valbyensis NRRL Y-1626]|uniref:p53-like transcription factor n=1 Tax=Hanseniaspora valbyensis NRRL Y-1626 TaxID=766949 RepID=A0A1B7TBU2_9ASCO|nr:p53-like transcription factor [Hanseniaspora valbyensis NRRL Y-1626]